MKSKKGIIIIISIVIVLILIIGLILLVINKNKYDPSYEIITNLTTISNANKLYDYYNDYNYGKILKSSGVFEGLYEINNSDVYKISIDTSNLMFFERSDSSIKNVNTFYFLDNENIEQTVAIRVYDGINYSSDIYEITGKKYTYNDWIFDRYTYNYKLSKDPNQKACIEISILGDGKYEKLAEDKFIDFSKKLINCIKVEYQGKINSSNKNKCQNELSTVDMSNIKLSSKIGLNLLNNTKVKYVANQAGLTVSEHIYGFETNSGDSFEFAEMKYFSLTEYKNLFPDFSWITFDYSGMQFTVAYKDENLNHLFFEVEGITYRITPYIDSDSIDYDLNYVEMARYILQNFIIFYE